MKPGKKAFIIGIAGGSGSGKSTLAAMLKEDLSADRKVAVLGADQFFKKPLPKMVSPNTGKEMDDYNCPDSIDYVALMAKTEELQQENDVVIVEGNGIFFFPAVRDMFDLKIFVDLPIEERMYRRIARNIKAGRGTMEEIASFYLESARHSEAQYLLPTIQYADIVLRGDTFQDVGKDVVVGFVKGRT